MNAHYTATVAREGSWWVITVPGVGVTQARTREDAPAAAADLIAAMLDIDVSETDVSITHE